MTDIVNSLFGLGPQEIRAEKLKANRERSLGLGQLVPQGYGAIVAGAGDIGFALGEGLGSLFGMEDPQLTRAKKIESVLQSIQGELSPEEMADPGKLYPLISDKLLKEGLGEEAVMASDYGSKLKVEFDYKQAQIKNIREKDLNIKKTDLELAQNYYEQELNKLKDDPENEYLQQSVNNAKQAINNLLSTKDKESLNDLLGRAIKIKNDKNSSIDQKEWAEGIIRDGSALKKIEGMYNVDSGEYEFIPGTKSYEEQIGVINKDITKFESIIGQAGNVQEKVADAMKYIRPEAVGQAAAASKLLPEIAYKQTPAGKLDMAIQAFKNNIGLDALVELKSSGTTLGQVAVFELRALQDSIDNLDTLRTEEELKKGLQRVAEKYQEWKDAARLGLRNSKEKLQKKTGKEVTSGKVARPQDIEATMKATGLSREEVIQKLKDKGYKIQGDE